MNSASKPVYFIGIVFLAVAAIAGFSQMSKKEIIPWRASWGAAQKEATETNKPLFIYFTATWCGPCQSLKSTTWADRDVEAALQAYVPVKLDEAEHQKLLQQYQIRAFPTFIVADSNAAETRRTEGALPPAEFLRWLQSVR
jgi:thiol:disulfide interchange protein